jgi:hypothetical protein
VIESWPSYPWTEINRFPGGDEEFIYQVAKFHACHELARVSRPIELNTHVDVVEILETGLKISGPTRGATI